MENFLSQLLRLTLLGLLPIQLLQYQSQLQIIAFYPLISTSLLYWSKHPNEYLSFPQLQKIKALQVCSPLLKDIFLSDLLFLEEKITYSCFNFFLRIVFHYLFFYHLEKNVFHKVRIDNTTQNLLLKIAQINALIAPNLSNHFSLLLIDNQQSILFLYLKLEWQEVV